MKNISSESSRCIYSLFNFYMAMTVSALILMTMINTNHNTLDTYRVK